ncbi:hypothetical protein BCR39DRAFT_587991 [Naematelia encephala]|uniref:Uncharacterized protein n=1 Tax=Naematelia encephala TaxID=71784 RepID=A0A1Y2B5T7_9TREE|nr:hypothetical protein BCR39DRAFT_587991 [Naematelia encephala]
MMTQESFLDMLDSFLDITAPSSPTVTSPSVPATGDSSNRPPAGQSTDTRGSDLYEGKWYYVSSTDVRAKTAQTVSRWETKLDQAKSNPPTSENEAMTVHSEMSEIFRLRRSEEDTHEDVTLKSLTYYFVSKADAILSDRLLPEDSRKLIQKARDTLMKAPSIFNQLTGRSTLRSRVDAAFTIWRKPNPTARNFRDELHDDSLKKTRRLFPV